MNESIIIGKVIDISNTTVSVHINKESLTSYRVNRGKSIRVGGVNNFVKIDNSIYEVSNDRTNIDNYDANSIIRVLSCNLVGFFESNMYFQGSNGKSPSILDDVFSVSSEDYIRIYTGNNDNLNIEIGEFLFRKDIRFKLDIPKFFASHSLIVGNTGSGKSNTLNVIYTNLFKKIDCSKSRFLIIDTNGEYRKSFTTLDKRMYKVLAPKGKERRMNIELLKMPINMLEAEDWKLLLEATEKTQYPLVKTVVNGIKRNVFNQKISSGEYIISEMKKTLISVLNSNNTPSNKLSYIYNIKEEFEDYKDQFYLVNQVFFDKFDDYSVYFGKISKNGQLDDTNELIKYIEDYVLKNKFEDNERYIKSKTDFTLHDFGFLLTLTHLFRINKYAINENNTSPMLARFSSNKADFEEILLPYKARSGDLNIEDFLFDNSNILICDVSKTKKDIRRIMVSLIGNKLFRQYTEHDKKGKSLHIIIDEAHNYLSNQSVEGEDSIGMSCIETFESIIKEGRKYSVFLTISTQRPSDITQTILSQAHNYIIHKLVNPKDIDVIKNSVPFIDEVSMKMISILAPGQAIFSGTAFNKPNIIKVRMENTPTIVDSETIKLEKEWKILK